MLSYIYFKLKKPFQRCTHLQRKKNPTPSLCMENVKLLRGETTKNHPNLHVDSVCNLLWLQICFLGTRKILHFNFPLPSIHFCPLSLAGRGLSLHLGQEEKVVLSNWSRPNIPFIFCHISTARQLPYTNWGYPLFTKWMLERIWVFNF